MSRVVHFEIQADHVDRAIDFYTKVLGWKITQTMSKEKDGMDYWLVNTGEDSMGINGGLYSRPDNADEKYYLYDCTIGVGNLDEIVEAVKKNGGTITKEKSEIPGVGWFAGAMDTEGNRFGIMQPTAEWM
jgi:uncharacterized protein